jgi:hypothetical protein
MTSVSDILLITLQAATAVSLSKHRISVTECSVTSNLQRQILSTLLPMLNRLAHDSDGELQAWALKVKVDVAGKLIVREWAVANGSRPNGTVGLTIDGKQLAHVPLQLLEPTARACVRQQIGFLPATAPLAEFLDSSQLELFCRQSASEESPNENHAR